MSRENNKLHFLSMFDGICDQTRELKTVSGKMPNDEMWVISSSGRHMFVDFVIDMRYSRPGFSANIHFGNEINNFTVKYLYSNYKIHFQLTAQL